MRKTPALVLVTAALLLAGCSGTAQDAGAAGTPTVSAGTTTAPATTGTTTTRPHTTGTAAPIPTSAVAYADDFVRAWGRGDDARAAQLSTDGVLQTLDGLAGPRWARVLDEGAAGTIYVTYRHDDTGQQFVLRVDNAAAGQGQEHAVYDAQLGTP